MRLVENSIFETFGHIIYRSFLKTTYFIPVIDENDIFFGGRGFFSADSERRYVLFREKISAGT